MCCGKSMTGGTASGLENAISAVAYEYSSVNGAWFVMFAQIHRAPQKHRGGSSA